MAARALLAALILSGALVEAMSHEAPSGWRYPTHCCWSPETAPAGRPGDCDHIPVTRVKEGPDGYDVTLQPGDHPMVKAPLRFIVPYAKAQISPDGEYHVCFMSDLTPRCFFAGARGS